VKRFRGGLVFEAHRLVYHSTLGLIIIKKKKDVIIQSLSQLHTFPKELLSATQRSPPSFRKM